MKFDFETVPSGQGHHRLKWDSMQARTGISDPNAISMWVADMDFAPAPCVVETLQSELDSGFLGYFAAPQSVYGAICNWMADRHEYTFDPQAIRFTHGVVAGFATTLAAFSEPGDSVILFTPVYHAFFTKIEQMQRRVHQAELVLNDGMYSMDLDALEASLTGDERVLVFCNPHNPGGRIWTSEEVRQVAAFCEKHDLILISDEIHMDLTFPGVSHVVTSVEASDFAHRIVTLSSASKGFNLAGGETGFVIIEDDDLRRRFDVAHQDRGGTPNRFGALMLKSAFTSGADWSAAVRETIAGNFQLWHSRIGALPGVDVMDMNATYLAWVDFRGTGMNQEQTVQRIQEDAKIAVSHGTTFGNGGLGWHRFNIATSRARVTEAIERLECAFSDLQ